MDLTTYYAQIGALLVFPLVISLGIGKVTQSLLEASEKNDAVSDHTVESPMCQRELPVRSRDDCQ